MKPPVLVACAAGLVAGVGGSLITNAWLGRRPPPREPAGGTSLLNTESRQPHDRTVVSPEAIAALALAAAASQRSNANQPANTVALPTLPARDREASEFQAALDDHTREPDDPAWADRVKRGLSADLDALSKETGITRFELDCRSKTCSGVIEWPSRLAAHQHLPQILHKEYTINSAVRLLPPDEAHDGSFRVPVIFEPAP